MKGPNNCLQKCVPRSPWESDRDWCAQSVLKGDILSWQQNLAASSMWFWFYGHENARMKLSPKFQKLAKAWLDSWKEALRSLHFMEGKAKVGVELPGCWRCQDGKMCAKIAAWFKWSQSQGQARCAAGSRDGWVWILGDSSKPQMPNTERGVCPLGFNLTSVWSSLAISSFSLLE